MIRQHAMPRTVIKTSDPPNECAVRDEACATSIEVTGLHVVRSRVPVLIDIHLKVLRGETLAVMGPNSAGKSTLLKCLAGALRPSSGELRVFGQGTTDSRTVYGQIGYVGHEFGLYRELTVHENLEFAGRMNGIPRPADRATKLVRDSGLEWTSHRLVGKLSPGVCRRAAICRALIHEPGLILLDEPFASLDEGGRLWLEGLFEEWRSKGRTVCFSSHDRDQSRVLADRILWLTRGRVTEREEIAFQVIERRSA